MTFKEFSNFTLPKLKSALESFNATLLSKLQYNILQPEYEHFTKLNGGGKYVRGLLVLLGYFLGKNYTLEDLNNAELLDECIPLAVAMEVFQTSVLMQDDVIDQDNLRRNVKTLHTKIVEENSFRQNALHYANSVAMLLGSITILESTRLIINNYKHHKNFDKVLDTFNSMKLNTYIGELIDVKLSFMENSLNDETKYYIEKVLDFVSNDKKPYDATTCTLQMYKLKTVDYTIFKPLMLGLNLSGKQVDEEILKTFSNYLGVAFQIQDDYLGIFGNMEKDGCSDIKEGKKTLLYDFTLSKPTYFNELKKYYGKKELSDEDIKKVQDIFDKNLAKETNFKLFTTLYLQAETLCKKLNFVNEDNANILVSFIEYLKNRNK